MPRTPQCCVRGIFVGPVCLNSMAPREMRWAMTSTMPSTWKMLFLLLKLQRGSHRDRKACSMMTRKRISICIHKVNLTLQRKVRTCVSNILTNPQLIFCEIKPLNCVEVFLGQQANLNQLGFERYSRNNKAKKINQIK